MIKTRKIKVKSIENEEIIMAMTMTKTIIRKIFIMTMIMRSIIALFYYNILLHYFILLHYPDCIILCTWML